MTNDTAATDIATTIEAAILNALPGSRAQVAMAGNHAHIDVISDRFEGLSPVKKQQLVYSVLQDLIASGAVHAVHLKTLTPAEAAR